MNNHDSLREHRCNTLYAWDTNLKVNEGSKVWVTVVQLLVRFTSLLRNTYTHNFVGGVTRFAIVARVCFYAKCPSMATWLITIAHRNLFVKAGMVALNKSSHAS